jgi:Flp pilus assembly protein TadG
MIRRPARSGWRRTRDEAGYAAILVALLASTVFIGMAAMGVDTARWYLELERVQQAADAGALAGVTYMPNDFDSAKSTAIKTVARNGYVVGDGVQVTVTQGTKVSELKVTVSSRVNNTFGGALGYRQSWMTRSATADYTAPAPMGSPCNVLGNEAPAGAKTTTSSALQNSAAANCFQDPLSKLAQPNFWAGIEGPETDKLQGDRYQTIKCSDKSDYNKTERTYGCSSNQNDEYNDEGYYFMVHVEQAAVGAPIDIQVYDPAYVNTGLYCSDNVGTPSKDAVNQYTTDGKTRYGYYTPSTSTTSPVRKYCPGDLSPGTAGSTNPTTTTFAMLNKTETNNPDKADPLTGCPPMQFRGFRKPTLAMLTDGNDDYDDQLARVYHQWVSVCTFTPTAKGDYYLQVRTNISLGGTSSTNTKGNDPVIYTGNTNAYNTTGNTTTGAGANAFSIRAVTSSDALRGQIAVSAWERMPILQIAATPATFNLVRALPNAKGQYLTFDFFDAADGSTGTVKVLPPADATGDVKAASGVPNCKVAKNDSSTYTSLTGCTYAVSGSYTDGQVIKMVIPIPTNYDCDNTKLTGCWFQVQSNYGDTVTDFTTWSANVGGDPVRLIE